MADEAEEREQHNCTDCGVEIPQEELVMLWSPSANKFEYWCSDCAELRTPETA